MLRHRFRGFTYAKLLPWYKNNKEKRVVKIKTEHEHRKSEYQRIWVSAIDINESKRDTGQAWTADHLGHMTNLSSGQ